MAEKKVLITGANGYIGKHVTNYLSQKSNCEIIPVDILKNSDSKNSIALDILNYEKDDLYEKLSSPDIIIHLAWQDGFNHYAESHLKNLYSHFNFIKKMCDSGCKSITVMGSMHEVGYYEGEINSDTSCNPLSLYGIAKNALRQACFSYVSDKDISLKWLRGFYIIGDDFNNKSIFTKIVQLEKEGKETFPFTMGTNRYDFIDIDEIASQIAEASLQNEISGIINCCSGKPVALKDKVEEFIKEKGLKIRPLYGVFPDRKYDSPYIYGNVNLIKKIMENSKQKV